MSLEKRLKLIRWAEENSAFIIENDYEHEINNWQNHSDSIFSLDTSNRTVFLGTFNRILHPSIRLGYMILPPKLIPAVKALQMHSHRFVPQSLQVVMTHFIDRNLIYRHVRRVIEEAVIRKQHFTDNFRKHFAEGNYAIGSGDSGGFHLLIDVPKSISSDAMLVESLEKKGIASHSLSQCYLDGEPRNGLIIGYSCVGKVIMSQHIQRMAGILP
jgi:GntR family transcriptional regulator/MocR family aminotransferase